MENSKRTCRRLRASRRRWIRVNEEMVRARLRHGFSDMGANRRIALMRYPFSSAETVDSFRNYCDLPRKAIAALDPAG